MTGPDYIVDIPGLTQREPAAPVNRLYGRPWLAVRWRCCGVYTRVYRNILATAYEGRCPRCQRPLKVPIGPGGTSNRFFETT